MSVKEFVHIGRYAVKRKTLDRMKNELRLAELRRSRLNILRAMRQGRDPLSYDTYRSPQFDTMPGAPEKVSNPTLQRVVEFQEFGELLYLEAWVEAFDTVMNHRLDDIQLTLVNEYVLKPKAKRDSMESIVDKLNIDRRWAFRRLNEALLEFILAIHGEEACTNKPLFRPSVG